MMPPVDRLTGVTTEVRTRVLNFLETRVSRSFGLGLSVIFGDTAL